MDMSTEHPLDQSIQFLKSVGPKRAEIFSKVGIRTIRDVLFYFPYRHLDRSTLLTSHQAYEHVFSGFEGEITIVGKVETVDKRFARGRDVLVVHMKDRAGFFECVWFQGARFFERKFQEGDYYAISAKPSISTRGELQFLHPDFDKLSDEESVSFFNTGKIIPFYRLPQALRTANIGELSLRKITSYALESYITAVDETLPDYLINKYHLMPLQKVVEVMHYPESPQELQEAKHRLKFEELFYLEMLVALRKNNYKLKLKGNRIKPHTSLVKDFISTLPYELTGAQKRSLREIYNDLEKQEPMNRLLQGDVGSGKTITALIAMLAAVDSGFQAVLMAPTEILADQHSRAISKLLAPLNAARPDKPVRTALLLGGQTKRRRKAELTGIESQTAEIILGTHALFEEGVIFKNLGMVVIDEQHRFGVAQRARLQQKGTAPECLLMSATPIPRTLTMSVYGDLDVSVIDEMPKNRIPIRTSLRGEEALPKIYAFIHEKAKEGNQAFVVYPLVEESEKVELKAAQQYYEDLKVTYFKDLRVGLLHGRMKWTEKEDIMMQFANKEFDVLVATTVIEVGIDIPAANIMVINDAHHFGLSQLHQLRGRVGRGTEQAYCILVAPNETAAASARLQGKIEYLSPEMMEKYKASIRLQSMVQYLNGFKIAEIDMKLRGPGDIFGTKQSGFPEFKYANLAEDVELLATVKQEAFGIIEQDAKLQQPNNSIIRNNLIKHYSDNLKYAKIA
ncbi:MAG: ATP-dependent DNA helicase RecG [Ignavibacteriales bacterium]|nr:ATP-dependent DNA helicase RecG [Ignavibacteriales bacterium]